MNKAKINLMIHETDILSSISKTKKNKEVKLHLFYLSLIFLF
ncbi:putative SNARE associated Golgi protein, partial [Plasmodium gaboni]